MPVARINRAIAAFRRPSARLRVGAGRSGDLQRGRAAFLAELAGGGPLR